MRRWCIAVMLAMCVCALVSCSDERENLSVRMADSLKITAYVLNSDLEGKRKLHVVRGDGGQGSRGLYHHPRAVSHEAHEPLGGVLGGGQEVVSGI